MGFWGLEVKPGKPQTYNSEEGRLHVTQATLGAGSSKEKSVIQCSIGAKNPIYLCSLLPNKTECCPLNLQFDVDDEPVEFLVTGDRSIHLSGFLEPYELQDDEDDSDGMDMGESESGESSDYDSEEDDHLDEFEDFLDSNLEIYRKSSVPKSRVVIEEIEDEEKSAKENKTKRTKKKSQASEDENAKKEIVAIESVPVPVLESEDEDEDGLPILKEEAPEPVYKSGVKMDKDEQGSNKKRKAKASEQDGVQESANKSKKKKNQKEEKKEGNATNEEKKGATEQVKTGNVLKKQETSQISSDTKAQNETVTNAMGESSKTPDKSTEKKNKKQKKKNSSEEAKVENKTSASSLKKQPQEDSKSSQVRTYPNGLVVEELHMGKPNARKAEPGKTVAVRYIGKLLKNGKIFDSNIGKSPFNFRLGVGQVIKGWDVGVNGMRVGDKRKLTIPPAMGYGSKGAGAQIPPNAWLTFDVEVVNVK